jgi:chromate transporter
LADALTERTAAPAVSLSDLFLGFLQIGLYGFGGVGAIARYVIVDKRRWLDGPDYLALLAVGQVLPGGNVINTSIMLGDRFRGLPGALAALSGLLVAPLCILILLGLVYDRVGGTPAMQAITAGGGAAAAGLVIGTGIRLGRGIKPEIGNIVIGAVAIVALGVLQLPLPLIVLVLLPLSVGWALRRRRS